MTEKETEKETEKVTEREKEREIEREKEREIERGRERECHELQNDFFCPSKYFFREILIISCKKVIKNLRKNNKKVRQKDKKTEQMLEKDDVKRNNSLTPDTPNINSFHFLSTAVAFLQSLSEAKINDPGQELSKRKTKVLLKKNVGLKVLKKGAGRC